MKIEKHFERALEIKNTQLKIEYLRITSTLAMAERHFNAFKRECEEWLNNIYSYGLKKNEQVRKGMKYWKQVAEMLGVEINQEFYMKYAGGNVSFGNKYRISEDGVQIYKDEKWEPATCIQGILNGNLLIETDFNKFREDIMKDIRGEP